MWCSQGVFPCLCALCVSSLCGLPFWIYGLLLADIVWILFIVCIAHLVKHLEIIVFSKSAENAFVCLIHPYKAMKMLSQGGGKGKRFLSWFLWLHCIVIPSIPHDRLRVHELWIWQIPLFLVVDFYFSLQSPPPLVINEYCFGAKCYGPYTAVSLGEWIRTSGLFDVFLVAGSAVWNMP